MKNLFFALFVSSIFVLASCGSPAVEEQTEIKDSLVVAVDSATVIVDSTVIAADTIAAVKQ